MEGNNYASDLWGMEHSPVSLFPTPSGDTVNFYQLYPQDIAMLADHGLNALRLGVEWARIEPEKGLISKAELEHYKRVMDTALEHGVTPLVTLHHFSTPRWVIREGGWENSDTAKWAAEHTARVVEALGDRVNTYFTINEMNTPQQLAGVGMLPPEVFEHLPELREGFAKSFGVEPPMSSFPSSPSLALRRLKKCCSKRTAAWLTLYTRQTRRRR